MISPPKEVFSNAPDWTSAVEGMVRTEFVRRRNWLRVYLALLLLLMVATLALLVMGVTEVTDMRRSVGPVVATMQRLDVTTSTLTQSQAAIETRLRSAEAELAKLSTEVAAQRAAPQAAPAEPPIATPKRRRAAGPSALQRQVANLDQRLQHVEAAASAAEADRARMEGRLTRIDDAVHQLGAAVGPQSAP